MRWRLYKESVRKNPKLALELDLTIGVVGLVIAFIGGAITLQGVHSRWSSSTAPNPALGALVFWVGVVVIALGVCLAVLNVLFYMSARRKGGDSGSSFPKGPSAL